MLTTNWQADIWHRVYCRYGEALINTPFLFRVVGLCVVGVGGGGCGWWRGGCEGWRVEGGTGRAECVGGVGVMLCFD